MSRARAQEQVIGFDRNPQAVRSGQMRLIDGGRHRIVATDIDNLIHAISLAIDHGSGGPGYYVFDDGSTTIRDFLTGLCTATRLAPPTR